MLLPGRHGDPRSLQAARAPPVRAPVAGQDPREGSPRLATGSLVCSSADCAGPSQVAPPGGAPVSTVSDTLHSHLPSTLGRGTRATLQVTGPWGTSPPEMSRDSPAGTHSSYQGTQCSWHPRTGSRPHSTTEQGHRVALREPSVWPGPTGCSRPSPPHLKTGSEGCRCPSKGRQTLSAYANWE